MTPTGLRPISLHLLSDSRIEAPEATITPAAAVVFAMGLILILDREKEPMRRQIEALLWPTVDNKTRSHRFRQTLTRLRACGFEISEEEKSKVILKNPVSIDADSVCRESDLEGLARYASVLPGYTPAVSEEFAEWVDARRKAIVSKLVRPLLASLSKHRSRGEWTLVERDAQILLQLSPLNEEATLSLAEAFAMRGAKIDAVQILDDYLAELGGRSNDLRLPATTLRKRIVDRLQPRTLQGFEEVHFVGRGIPMTRLAESLAEAKARHGKKLIVRGNAGIGKTRLLSEFANFAILQGCAVQRINCRPGDQLRPLSVVLDIVPHLRQLRGAIGCSPQTILYLDRISKVRDNDIRTNEEREDPELVFERIERALFDLFDAVSADSTVVLIVEDVHWCDSISSRVLAQMATWCDGRKALLVCSERHQGAADSDSLDAIELPPLDLKSATDLMSALPRQRGLEIDPDYLAWSLRIAEGNPFFLEELAKQWLETGSQHAIPASLKAVIDQRISRLRPDALQTLQTLAVLEDYATFSRLEETLRSQPYELLSSLSELASAGMISVATQGDGLGSADALSTKHDLVSSSAVALLPKAALTYLHRRVATVLEAELGTNTSAAVLWDCAKHWEAAGDPSRAFQLARSCASHLIEVGLPGEAAVAYETALKYVSSPEERLDLLRALTRAYYYNAAWNLAATTEEAARQLRSTLYPNQTQHDDLELMALRALFRDGLSQAVVHQTTQCLASADATADHKITAGALTLMQLDVMGRHDEMKAVFDQIESLAKEQSIAPSALFEARVVFHSLCGDLRLAAKSSDELVATQRQQGGTSDLFRALTNAAVTHRALGSFEKAEQYLFEAIEKSEKHRSFRSVIRALLMLGHMAVERGDQAAATAYFKRVNEQPVVTDDVYATLDRGALGARIALLNGDVSMARRWYPDHYDAVARDRSIQMRTYQLALAIAIQMAAGETINGVWLQELESAHLRTRRSLAQAFAAYVLHFALLATGKRSRARKLLDEYEMRFRREPWRASKLFDDLKSALRPTRN